MFSDIPIFSATARSTPTFNFSLAKQNVSSPLVQKEDCVRPKCGGRDPNETLSIDLKVVSKTMDNLGDLLRRVQCPCIESPLDKSSR